jgi:P-type Cu2+ transporter
MHPHVIQSNPGLCPICKMTLKIIEKKSEDNQKIKIPSQDVNGMHSCHEHMIHDFIKRLWFSIILTVPIILLSPMLKNEFPFKNFIAFPFDLFLLFIFSSLIYFYGGWPFLKGLFKELQSKKPGMITLIGLAITVAYIYIVLLLYLDLEVSLSFGNLPPLLILCYLGTGLR